MLAAIVVSVLVGQELVVRYTYYYQEYPRQDNVIQYFQYGLDHALVYARARETDYDEIWVTDVNQPYIYVLYDHTWPPSDVHQNLVLRRQPPDFNEVELIGKYHFGDPPGVNAAGLGDPRYDPRPDWASGVRSARRGNASTETRLVDRQAVVCEANVGWPELSRRLADATQNEITYTELVLRSICRDPRSSRC